MSKRRSGKGGVGRTTTQVDSVSSHKTLLARARSFENYKCAIAPRAQPVQNACLLTKHAPILYSTFTHFKETTSKGPGPTQHSIHTGLEPLAKVQNDD